MAIEKIENMGDENVALFIEQFQKKPRLEALARVFLDRCQELENVFWDIIEKRLIENAVGVQLDVLGKIVGQPRIGDTDDIYRLHIRARIRINISNGTPNDILEIAALLLQGARFSFDEYYPASFVIDVLDPMLEDPFFVWSLIGEARAAGVGHSLYFSDDDEDDTFAFAEGDIEEDDTARGFSDDDEDDPGGSLVNCI